MNQVTRANKLKKQKHQPHKTMTRDNEIAAIFNPRRVRTPSVVVTGDSPNGSFTGGFTNIINSSNPQIGRSDSISQPDGVDSVICVQGTTNLNSTNLASSTPTPNTEIPPGTAATAANISKFSKCKESCCSELAQKVIIANAEFSNPFF